jgi:HSP20 family protein
MLTLWRNDANGLFAEMDRLMEGIAGPTNAWTGGLAPAADVVETQDGYQIVLDLPGHAPESIQVDVKDETLTVKAERKQPAGVEGETWHRSERSFGTFFRAFTLPRTVDAGAVEATYEQGVLTLRLPKRAEAKPRTIAVKTA